VASDQLVRASLCLLVRKWYEEGILVSFKRLQGFGSSFEGLGKPPGPWKAGDAGQCNAYLDEGGPGECGTLGCRPVRLESHVDECRGG
jgi:hypothetical protein